MIPLLTTEGSLPPGIHKCNPDECRLRFVNAFSGTNRQALYEEWQAYTKRLQSILQLNSLVQWIDGSFVTDKLNPGDIDVVTFVPYVVYEPLENTLIDFYSTITRYESGLDVYLCPVYPVSHHRYNLYRQFRQDWKRLFDSHRSLTSRKGFLEITLLYGE